MSKSKDEEDSEMEITSKNSHEFEESNGDMSSMSTGKVDGILQDDKEIQEVIVDQLTKNTDKNEVAKTDFG